jgi:hypothetical protein
MRIVRLRRRARILDGPDVLSEILDHPGPTDTLFDVLAACVAALAPGPRVAILGFAGGGIVAPLRAMGFDTPLETVDVSLRGLRLFRELAGSWAGRVSVERGDAAAWLGGRRGRYHLILEDLSAPASKDQVGVKPAISLEALPELMKRRLTTNGVAVTNLLPMPGRSWKMLLQRLASPFGRALVVHADQYENRILLAGGVADARRVSWRLRAALARIGSMQTHSIRVRRLDG